MERPSVTCHISTVTPHFRLSCFLTLIQTFLYDSLFSHFSETLLHCNQFCKYADDTNNSPRISGYQIDDCCSANNNCNGDRAIYRTDCHASVILFITTSMDDHDEERRKHIWIVHSGKSEVKLELDVLKLLTETKHRVVSTWQKGYTLSTKDCSMAHCNLGLWFSLVVRHWSRST